MVLHRATQRIEHRFFRDLVDYLHPEELIVLNNSKVIAARLFGRKKSTGAKIEMLLIEELGPNCWWALLKPGKRAQIGSKLRILKKRQEETAIDAIVMEKNSEGQYRLAFAGVDDLRSVLPELGEIPLPPYIERLQSPDSGDAARYQTVFAGPEGSVAAPTAGLHFTSEMLEQIKQRKINCAEVTLHIGMGTFAPVKVENLEVHPMHEEKYEVPRQTAELVEKTKQKGKRIIAVGTTSLRVLESEGQAHGKVLAGAARTRLFIYPPYQFRIVDSLLTNFHLPESTLLMLVSAFACPGGIEGRSFVLRAYQEAIREGYRFFSYGDAMLIL